MKIIQIYDGRPQVVKLGKVEYQACCLCGSVDRVVVTPGPVKGTVTMIFWHDDKMTAREQKKRR